ncbi:hypothetical protein [Gordonia polyisoprenivorans]|uniref:hypothetical protein n=1 Tax=Gordonia polyisoprenivorans TaxID=84595 RepID=UPI00230009AA|nr:hypothetical protein [Gordonia polyisoprenivorans]WCB39463.1 hypothetical protein PHA63_10325 [Gordonia polyisoprenivorans]
MVATIVIPWLLAVYYVRSPAQGFTEEVRLVVDFHTKAAVAAGGLLVSTVLLRVSGRSVAATVPFAIMWALALAYAISQIRMFSGQFNCGPEVDLCIPDFGLFITVVPFAVAVSFAVLGSAMINRSRRRDDDGQEMRERRTSLSGGP